MSSRVDATGGPRDLFQLRHRVMVVDPSSVEVIVLLNEYFQDDFNKLADWLTTDNPYLGYISPLRMIQLGKTDRLIGVINALLEGDLP